MTLAGQTFSNRYEIEREVAQGGMAEVYLARDQLLNRPVALKALFPEYAREPSFVERFRREAQAAANLNHPNIVAIYDWGQEEGTYFIVMEYVEGRSLRDLIRSEGPLEPGQAAEIAAEIASALAFAHRNGVVHRDVKPGNVLLTRTGNVKVTDFGIARAGTSDGLTQTGSVMGTATYFSPEQAQGMPVDGRSDVYSLGVVLYEIVTGSAPFTGDSPVAVAYKHVRETPQPASQRNPDVPPDLDQIINTALAKNPDERYQSADDMRADLLRFQRGRPLAAAPVTALVAEVPTTATRTAAATGAYAATVASPRVDDRGRLVDAPTYERRKRSNTALITILTIVGLAAVIAAILFAATKMGSSQKVSVPKVTGLTVADARSELQKAHLDVKEKHVTNANVPVDRVISQNPAAGKKVTRNSEVTITVSDGAQQVTIPLDIKNKSQQDATNQLTLLGFQVRPEPRESATVDKGNVIDSNPAAGTQAGKGSVVTLFVSSGPPPKEIPDVKGDSQDTAFQRLQQAGFTNIQPQQENSDSVQSGSATRTDPPAGTSIPTDQRVVLYISSGEKQFTVPSEVGRKYSDAKAELEAQGFTVGRINVVNDSNVGIVVDQSPAGDSQVTSKGTVTLRVGVASSTPTTSNSTTTTSGP